MLQPAKYNLAQLMSFLLVSKAGRIELKIISHSFHLYHLQNFKFQYFTFLWILKSMCFYKVIKF